MAATAEVPVTVRSGTLTSTQRLRIPGRSSASTRIVFEGTPTEVLVNDGDGARGGVVGALQAVYGSVGGTPSPYVVRQVFHSR